MADVRESAIQWGGGAPPLAGYEPVVGAGKTFKIGPMGGELYDVNRRAAQEEALGYQAIAKGKQELAKGRQEETVLKNTMALLGSDATQFDVDAAKQYAATFGTLPIDPATHRIDKVTLHGNLEKYSKLRMNMEIAKASSAGMKSEKTTQVVDGRIHDILVHTNAMGQIITTTDLGPQRESMAKQNEATQKELTGYTGILDDIKETRDAYDKNAAKVKGWTEWAGQTGGMLIYPLAGKIQSFNIYDKDIAKLKGNLESMLSNLSRTLGAEVGNMSDSDIARWKQSVPSTWSPPEVAHHLLNTLEQRVKKRALDRLEMLDQSGVVVSPKATQLFGVTPEKWDSYVTGAQQGRRGLQFLTGEKDMPGTEESAAPTTVAGVYFKNGRKVHVDSEGRETEVGGGFTIAPQTVSGAPPTYTAPVAAAATPTVAVGPFGALGQMPINQVPIGVRAIDMINSYSPVGIVPSIMTGQFGQNIRAIAPGFGTAWDMVSGNAAPKVPMSQVPVASITGRPSYIPAAGLVPPDLSATGYAASQAQAALPVNTIPITPTISGLPSVNTFGILPQ